MQTFLPFKSFERSAAVLDRQRLGKQRVETLQIMIALVMNKGWVNHPATQMWRGYEYSLLEYQLAVCTEWHVIRGYSDTCLRKTMDVFWSAPYLAEDAVDPHWLGDPDFHRSHRSNLYRKDEDIYLPDDVVFERDLPDDLEYVWPK